MTISVPLALLTGAILFATGATSAVAQSDTTDLRSRVDVHKEPWRGIGKVQATAGGLRETCTGALVGPQTVLTAAHCLFNVRTGHNFSTSALHFLLGLDGQTYSAAAGIVSMVTGPGYDAAQPAYTRGSDWALLTIDIATIDPAKILPISKTLPTPGAAVMIGGYGQDHPNVLTADLDCRVVDYVIDRRGRRLFRHDCATTRGVSGAPVLVYERAAWRICGVTVAQSKKETTGLAALVEEAREQL